MHFQQDSLWGRWRPLFRRVGHNGLTHHNYLLLKRSMDIVLGVTFLVLCLPVLALCALAIKLDTRGPVFFLQERTGQGGRRFKMVKLRTMVVGADQLKERYQHLSHLSYPDFKISNDPRISQVGHVLRRTSLDELPQLINVILGDMSLVGPRPTSFAADTYGLWHTERLSVKPGLTGLWQVSGRSNIEFDDRARLDIAYIRGQCLSLDIKILLRTLLCMIVGQGAE